MSLQDKDVTRAMDKARGQFIVPIQRNIVKQDDLPRNSRTGAWRTAFGRRASCDVHV